MSLAPLACLKISMSQQFNFPLFSHLYNQIWLVCLFVCIFASSTANPMGPNSIHMTQEKVKFESFCLEEKLFSFIIFKIHKFKQENPRKPFLAESVA